MFWNNRSISCFFRQCCVFSFSSYFKVPWKMNTYFLQVQRGKTKSNLKLHIEANDERDAQTFAHRQLNTVNETNWICWNVVQVKCPNIPYDEYKGHRIWISKKGFAILKPGEIKCIKHPINTTLESIQNFIDSELIYV